MTTFSNWDRKQVFRVLLTGIFLITFALLFLPFYVEILLAAVFALAIEPALGRWLKTRQARWRISVALILAAMFVALAAPVTLVAYKGYASAVEVSKIGVQNTEIYRKLTFIRDEGTRRLNRVLEKLGLEDQIGFDEISSGGLGSAANFALGFVTGLANQIPNILVSIFIFCAALYFFLAESAVIYGHFLDWKLLDKRETDRFLTVAQHASFNTVVSSLVIGALQASVVSIGGWICDVGDFMVVFVATFILSFIPVIGAAPVALVLAGYKALLGEYGGAIAMVVVAVVAGTVDNIVRPYLVSSSEDNLHPIVSLLAIIGALVVFGAPGILLGPVIASIAVKIVPTLYPRA